jgi:hypothetical protein
VDSMSLEDQHKILYYTKKGWKVELEGTISYYHQSKGGNLWKTLAVVSSIVH